MIGFVDGTENPVGQASLVAVIIGDEDPAFAGGSYVLVQKYLHDLKSWNALPVERQEAIIGRKKLSDIELDDAVKPSCAHSALTTIVENGEELKIVRDNIPFAETAKASSAPTSSATLARRPDRANAREHVYRQSIGQLRSSARFQPRDNGKPVLCSSRNPPRRCWSGWPSSRCAGSAVPDGQSFVGARAELTRH